MTASPGTIIGGLSTASNTVHLNSPVPTGGVVVSLSSSNPGVVPPPSITVPAGASVSPAFTITTSNVIAQNVVTITASYNGVNKTDTLTVNPVALLSVTASPGTVIGGLSTASNTVHLNSPAPTGGVVVPLFE